MLLFEIVHNLITKAVIQEKVFCSKARDKQTNKQKPYSCHSDTLKMTGPSYRIWMPAFKTAFMAFSEILDSNMTGNQDK